MCYISQRLEKKPYKSYLIFDFFNVNSSENVEQTLKSGYLYPDLKPIMLNNAKEIYLYRLCCLHCVPLWCIVNAQL